jgi:NAD(P)-dependent dehydrogenase (short-subunit alcohol dehydrogenase family)
VQRCNSFHQSFAFHDCIMNEAGELSTNPYWDFVLRINLAGVMQCLRAQLRVLQRPGGSIVNVSSTLGLRGQEKSAAYCSTKRGIIGFTKSAASEYGQQRIHTYQCRLPVCHSSLFLTCQEVLSIRQFLEMRKLWALSMPRISRSEL